MKKLGCLSHLRKGYANENFIELYKWLFQFFQMDIQTSVLKSYINVFQLFFKNDTAFPFSKLGFLCPFQFEIFNVESFSEKFSMLGTSKNSMCVTFSDRDPS